MEFAGINYFAVVLAAVASFLFGGAWYGALAKAWLAAIGKTEEQIKTSNAVVPMTLAALAMLVMAWVLAGLIGHLGTGQVTLYNGVVSGLFCWAGFVATTLVTNHAFQQAKRSLTLIDGGHWLGVLLIQGAVIGWLGV